MTACELDFARYGQRLAGPTLGAIATKKRQGGGHVFLVVGRTARGKLVGRGNQSDMVCDQEFDPDEIVSYTWPRSWPTPDRVGFETLPVVTPATKAKRAITLPAPSQAAAPGKGTVAAPDKKVIVGAPVGTGLGLGALAWQWIVNHPVETALLVTAGVLAVGATVSFINDRHRKQQEAATPGIFPVAA